MTEILFLNHSSVLIKYNQEYLLCDPWFQKPAFGSWLPTFPMFVHPTYISSLKNIKILISHGHDDHCDDDFLNLFDKKTQIISSDFVSPSVKNRVKRLGFDNYTSVDEQGEFIGDFKLISIRNDEISEDDALYVIKTPDSLIIHANDNWFELEKKHYDIILPLIDDVGIENCLYMSQTNSASGYPLNYILEESEKKKLLLEKVEKMISQGLQNCDSLGIKNFHSYAGYASVFVKGKENYLNDSIFPTPKFINDNLNHLIPDNLKVLNFYPGDVFNFKKLQKSFFSNNYNEDYFRTKSNDFYDKYKIIENCDTFRTKFEIINCDSKVLFFLNKFNDFVIGKLKKNKNHDSIIQKTIKIKDSDLNKEWILEFGKGIIKKDYQPNKTIIVRNSILQLLLDGEILFENLYTGYESEIDRYPKNVYNRDIVMFIVMFSYLYKNRIVKSQEYQSLFK